MTVLAGANGVSWWDAHSHHNACGMWLSGAGVLATAAVSAVITWRADN